MKNITRIMMVVFLLFAVIASAQATEILEYIVKPGDTLSEITVFHKRFFKVEERDIINQNPGINVRGEIKAGQSIFIPLPEKASKVEIQELIKLQGAEIKRQMEAQLNESQGIFWRNIKLVIIGACVFCIIVIGIVLLIVKKNKPIIKQVEVRKENGPEIKQIPFKLGDEEYIYFAKINPKTGYFISLKWSDKYQGFVEYLKSDDVISVFKRILAKDRSKLDEYVKNGMIRKVGRET